MIYKNLSLVGYNNIGNKGVIAISKELKINHTLQNLVLSTII